MNSEFRLAESLREQGFEVLTSGWPDLLVKRDGKWTALEVKGKGDTLKTNQLENHEALREAGIEVEVVDDTGKPWEGPITRRVTKQARDRAKSEAERLNSYLD